MCRDLAGAVGCSPGRPGIRHQDGGRLPREAHSACGEGGGASQGASEGELSSTSGVIGFYYVNHVTPARLLCTGFAFARESHSNVS